MEIQGECRPGFAGVKDGFQKNFADGLDVGASVAVAVDGELVVDLWAGHADAERSRPWERDTIVNVWSSSKTVSALCALMLVDRGQLDLDAPVSRYWPEFERAGKHGARVRHVLAHSAGVPGFERAIDAHTLYDWERATGLLAEQAAWWEPGTASGYHAITQGYLIGELVRRVDGRSLGAFLREEIAGPLDADFHIGLGASEDHRVADLIFPGPTGEGLTGLLDELGGLANRVLGNPSGLLAAASTEAWRRAEIPAANGHGNARAIARAMAPLAGDGSAWGTRLLSDKTCERVLEEQVQGKDRVLGIPLRFGLGFALAGGIFPLGPRAMAWGGLGGSVVIIDRDARMTFAFAMNRMGATLVGDQRTINLLMPVLGGLQSFQTAIPA
ncbi:MAG: serine hydrolase [Myxococcales bacterium]|nr:serine hydrolase [Myxococcales bacterium]